MMIDPHTLVRVHSDWDGWRSADIRVDHLEEIHWLRPGRAPHPLLHAYVSCVDIPAGTIGRECDPHALPHRHRVCILKRHTTPSVYAALAARAAAGHVPTPIAPRRGRAIIASLIRAVSPRAASR